MAIQMNVSGLRRNLKNIAHNYTDAQVKVREATSNDPWGPSSTLMSEIADLTYNVVAFSEIMQMVWKRLNDHGRNWRHVYKALVLLEYLIKTGSEKVADQCKENIYTIQTLKDFQYLEENKDMGVNVREKAKTLVSLLKDDERLRNERVRALKSKERIAQTVSAIGSDSDINSPTSPSYPDTYVTGSSRSERPASYGGSGLTRRSSSAEFENARPQTVGEEELQLQLALAMSKEEADQEEAKTKSDDVRLQMALSQSETDKSPQLRGKRISTDPRGQDAQKSALSDLLDINFNGNGAAAAIASSLDEDLWGMSAPAVTSAASSGSMSPQPPKSDPFGFALPSRELNTPKQNDLWPSPSSAPSSRVTSPPTTKDPWAPTPNKSPELPKAADPWSPVPTKPDPWATVPSKSPAPSAVVEAVDPFAPIPTTNIDEFSAISKREQPSDNDMMFDLSDINHTMIPENGLTTQQPERSRSKSPKTFLGENSNLVNLDNLVSTKATPVGMGESTSTSSKSYQNLNSLNNNNANAFDSTDMVCPPSFGPSNNLFGGGTLKDTTLLGLPPPTTSSTNSSLDPMKGMGSSYNDSTTIIGTSFDCGIKSSGTGMSFTDGIGINSSGMSFTDGTGINSCGFGMSFNSGTTASSGTGLSFTDDTSIISGPSFNIDGSGPSSNPFLGSGENCSSFVSGVNPFNNGPSPPNPFQAQQAPKPSMNQMMRGVNASPSNALWGTSSADQDATSRNDDPFTL